MHTYKQKYIRTYIYTYMQLHIHPYIHIVYLIRRPQQIDVLESHNFSVDVLSKLFFARASFKYFFLGQISSNI